MVELLPEESWWDALVSIVRTFVVVAVHPFVRKVADFVERTEEVCIEDFGAEAAVEAFDIAVLHGTAWLNELEVDVVDVAPSVQFGGDELRAVIDQDLGRQLPTFFELIQHANDTCRGQGSVHLDGERFPGSFIEKVEGAEAPSAVEAVFHEVHPHRRLVFQSP